MKLLYCTYKPTYRAYNEYYSDGSFPYFIPTLSSFFDEMYLMVPVSDQLPKGVSKLAKSSQIRVIDTKTHRNKYLHGIQGYSWSLENIFKFRVWQHKADVVLIGIPSTIHYLAYLPMIKKPLVVLVAGDEQEVLKTFDSSAINIERFTKLVKLRGVLEGYILRKCNAIICRNSGIKNKLIKGYNIPESKINIITSGIDVEIFRPLDSKSRELMRQNLGIKTDDMIIGFVATSISNSKGADTLIEVFTRLRNDYPRLKLLLIGENKLELGKDQSVISCGLVKKEDLPAYYNAMDIFVFPSKSEGAPKVIMEAFACGIPVIASNVGAVPGWITEAENGFLTEIGDTDKIVDSCKALLKREALRRKIGDKARLYAVTNFGFEKLTESVAKVIKKAATKN